MLILQKKLSEKNTALFYGHNQYLLRNYEINIVLSSVQYKTSKKH